MPTYDYILQYVDGSGNTLLISRQAVSTLESWTAFQRESFIFDEDNDEHWDVALLLTR